MTIVSESYRAKLREAIRLREHVQKFDTQISELKSHPSAIIEPNDAKDKLRALEDQKQVYTFMYKTQKDEFMAICEDVIKNQASSEARATIHEDLLQAGFDPAKDGVNHPHLKQLNHEM